MNKLKIIFMGTPKFSVPVLKGLIENYNVVAVVTQPDRMVGRKKVLTYSPVKTLALDNEIVVFQPEKIRKDYKDILNTEADIIITCAYGQLIPISLLESFKYKSINVHASLLPRLRGGAPIHKSIIFGEAQTGITIMYMEAKMDAGDILFQEAITIMDTDTASSLHTSLSIIGRDLLLEALPKIIAGDIKPIKQIESEVTFAYNVSRDEEKVDFNKTSREIFNQIRGLNSFPGAYAILNEKNVKIWTSRESEFNSDELAGTITNIYKDGFGVKTSNGEIVLTEIQFSGSKKMLTRDYLNGKANKQELIGQVFK